MLGNEDERSHHFSFMYIPSMYIEVMEEDYYFHTLFLSGYHA